MDKLFEKKEYILKFYTKYSKYVDKVLQFVLALLTFVFINNNIGFMKAATNSVVTLGLSVIGAFLPAVVIVILAAVMVIMHFYALSLGVAIAACMIFLIMFIMYFRFTPDKAILLVLTPIAFVLKVPMLIPIAFGLIGTPICAIPIAFGTIIYFMITYVKSFETTIQNAGKAESLGQLTAFIQQIFTYKEMWITIIAFTICLLVVYNVRRLSVDYSWKIAVIAGAVVYIVVMVLGSITMNVYISYVAVIFGSIVSVFLALILEFFVFSVDYTRTENLQFEDDEYYYYVKAVPKVSVAVPEKTIKRINERQDTSTIDIAQAIMNDTELLNDMELQKLFEDELKR